MADKNSPIGFFDSGVGGISVLKEAVRIMPYEDFIFFGDSKNAPYGTKPREEIRALTFKNVEFLMDMGIKGIVIACNTATSAAVKDLRIMYPDFPIVGIEPAIKPAVTECPGGNILVMATPMTIKQEKFQLLLDKFKEEADIVPMACPGLMEFVERGELDSEELNKYLEQVLFMPDNECYDGIVLGCTHYPFVLDAIKRIVGDKSKIFDGAYGTSAEIKRRIEAAGLDQADKDRKGSISFISSDNSADRIDLMNMLYKR